MGGERESIGSSGMGSGKEGVNPSSSNLDQAPAPPLLVFLLECTPASLTNEL